MTQVNAGVSKRIVELAPGVIFAPGWLNLSEQEDLLKQVRQALQAAPLVTPRMPRSGAPLSVRMSNCGVLGWVTDAEKGYRYEPTHPETNRAWPPIPALGLRAWRGIGGYLSPPEACLINWYGPQAKMGLHQDLDEEDLGAPVVSLSLGDTALFRLGGLRRRDQTMSFRLASGDAMALRGPARLRFHGVDRILSGSSSLLAEGGRFNLTLRRVTRAAQNSSEIMPQGAIPPTVTLSGRFGKPRP